MKERQERSFETTQLAYAIAKREFYGANNQPFLKPDAFIQAIGLVEETIIDKSKIPEVAKDISELLAGDNFSKKELDLEENDILENVMLLTAAMSQEIFIDNIQAYLREIEKADEIATQLSVKSYDVFDRDDLYFDLLRSVYTCEDYARVGLEHSEILARNMKTAIQQIWAKQQRPFDEEKTDDLIQIYKDDDKFETIKHILKIWGPDALTALPSYIKDQLVLPPDYLV